MFPIECEIPSLKLAIELLPNTTVKEERLLYLTRLDETHCDATLANETHNKHVKSQYDKTVITCVFSEGDLVPLYNQDREMMGVGKFEPMWHGPYIIKLIL
jgi:hypothetical protein